jgi:hypothetical protein
VLAADAYEAVEQKHAGLLAGVAGMATGAITAITGGGTDALKSGAQSAWQATTNVVNPVQIAKNLMGTKQSAIMLGVQVGLTVAFLLAGIGISAATSGAALPVLLLVAAGTWAAHKALGGGTTLFISNHIRRDRNWLQHYKEVGKSTRGHWARCLVEDSTDAIRRLIDHYCKARSAAEQLKRILKGLKDGECKIGDSRDAQKLAHHLALFGHELNKTRNYLMPCLDMVLFTLNHYLTVGQRWNTFFANFEDRLGQFLQGDHAGCSQMCYAPMHAGGMAPKKRKLGATGQMLRASGRTVGQVAHLDDVTAVIRGLMEFDKEIEKQYKAQEGKVLPPEQVVRQAVARAVTGRGWSRSPESLTKILVRIIDEAFKEVDKPSTITRLGHVARNAFTRTTTGEKVAIGVTEFASLALAVGGTWAGHACEQIEGIVFKGVDVLGKHVAEIATKDAAKGGVAISKGVMGALIPIITDVAFKKAFDNPATPESASEAPDDRLKALGREAVDRFKKMGKHGTAANDTLKNLDKKGQQNAAVASCDQLFEVCVSIMEVCHHYDKMLANTVVNLTMLSVILSECLDMTELEGDAFAAVQEHLAKWIATSNENLQ